MSGEVTVVTDAGSVDLHGGDAVTVPGDISHRIVDRGADPAVLLMLIAVPSP